MTVDDELTVGSDDGRARPVGAALTELGAACAEAAPSPRDRVTWMVSSPLGFVALALTPGPVAPRGCSSDLRDVIEMVLH